MGASLEASLAEFWGYQAMAPEGTRWSGLALELLADAPPSEASIKLWLSLSRYRGATGSSGSLDAAQKALAQAETFGDEALVAEAWGYIGFAFDRSGELDEAAAAYTKAVPVLKRVGHKKLLARLLSWWSIVHFVRGDSEAAQKGFTEALGIAKSLADDQLTNTVLGNLAELAFQQKDPAKAIAYSEEILANRRQGGNSVGNSNTYANRAAYQLALGQVDEARSSAHEAIRFGREHQYLVHIAYAVQHLAVIAARQGQPELAARLLGFVDEVNRRGQIQREPTEQWSLAQLMDALRERLPEDRIQALIAEGVSLTEDDAVEAALKI